MTLGHGVLVLRTPAPEPDVQSERTISLADGCLRSWTLILVNLVSTSTPARNVTYDPSPNPESLLPEAFLICPSSSDGPSGCGPSPPPG